MCGLLVNHLDVSVQGVLVDGAVLADTALERSLFQVDSTVMPLQSKLICCPIITNRTLMVCLRIFLMYIGYMSFQSTLMDRLVIASFTSKPRLQTFVMDFTLVPLESGGVTGLVITPQTLIELHLLMYCLAVSV